MRRLAVVLATAGGAGYAPIAPGTAGAAVGVLAHAATRSWTPAAQVALLVVIPLVGIWAANEAGRRFQNADPGQVVIDEVAGQMLTLLLLDVGLSGTVLAFVLFRLFDIVKPWPVRQLEALHGGLGVMADDLMAGVYGWLVMRALIWLAPSGILMGTFGTAEILAIGSELLTPHRIDTNSLFLTGRLNELGIVVRAKAIVGDERGDLAAILRGALERADLVITTGGLGPTDDDLTREVVASVLDRALGEDAHVLAEIEERFARRGVAMPAVNRRQAQVPHGAVVLPNAHGTAPGLLLEVGERVVVLLPGPPREMQPMFESHVAPRVATRTSGRQVRRRVIKITGRSESQVEEVAYPIYSTLGTPQQPVQTTILASPGQIELHLAATGANLREVDDLLDDGVVRLTAHLGSVVFSTDGRSLEAVVGALLEERGMRVAVAESCTGGLLLGRLTEVPGSSRWVTGGVVAYSNDMKVKQLGVAEADLAMHGAVSEPVASAMAAGVARLGADVGVGVTGIAGPDGGSPEKPVGTVVIAVSGAKPAVRTFRFPGDREAVRRHATSAALDMIRRSLI